MSTSTEDLIKQLKRSSRSKAILAPKIEKFMQRPVEIEDKVDRQYLRDLVRARSIPRRSGVYSPSALNNCLRQVYFLKTGMKKKRSDRIEASGFFLDGTFRHFKWQFIMWKMHRAGIIELIDVGSICLGAEIFVVNESGDYGGTLDNLFYLPVEDIVATVDWKGMNGNGFAKAMSHGPSHGYIGQSVGYAGLANSTLDLQKKIQEAFIIGENKNGPVNTRRFKSPLGLSEWRISLEDYRHIPANRLKTLRGYERREEIPPPECISTRRQMFKDCPFAYYCRGEIEKLEKKKRKAFRANLKKRKIKFDGKREKRVEKSKA